MTVLHGIIYFPKRAAYLARPKVVPVLN